MHGSFRIRHQQIICRTSHLRLHFLNAALLMSAACNIEASYIFMTGLFHIYVQCFAVTFSKSKECNVNKLQ